MHLASRLFHLARRLVRLPTQVKQKREYEGEIRPIFSYVEEISGRLEHEKYDLIVLIPHCRMGGSAFVAGKFSHALRAIYPRKQVLIIRTELPDFWRPDWFPEVETVDISESISALVERDRVSVLLELLRVLKPKTIFNINSKLAWFVLHHHTQTVLSFAQVYVYLFCYDINKLGLKLGYPVDYYPFVAKIVTGAFTDSDYLRDYLIDKNQLKGSDAESIKVLYTPRNDKVTEGVSKIALSSAGPQSRAKIFWAGRFDRQKRLDIVIEVARQRPDFTFYVWGKAMLDKSFDLSSFPENMIHMDTFSLIDELPLEQADLWLYTSQWDGLPTILIEIGARNVPLVASAVGGTVSLIREETAWPVHDYLNPQAYIESIDQCLQASDAQRSEKVNRMKALIDTRHTDASYQEQIRQALGG